MAQMRNLRRPARRLASALLIFSPVYSAIFRQPLKWATAKQPLPTIEDFLIARPGASVNFILLIVTQPFGLQSKVPEERNVYSYSALQSFLSLRRSAMFQTNLAATFSSAGAFVLGRRLLAINIRLLRS